jgi:hypothetical protein
MDSELKSLLEENLQISKENNKMLHKMRRAARWAFLWRILLWAIILGLPVYLYYLYLPVIQTAIKPFLPATKGTAGKAQESFFGLPLSPEQLQEILKQYKTLAP